jgi:hypothetical protein
VAEQFEPQFTGDPLLDGLQLITIELDNFPGLDVDQVVVMLLAGFLETGASIPEIQPLDHTGVLKQADGAVDGGDTDLGVDIGGTAVDLLDVRMVGRG